MEIMFNISLVPIANNTPRTVAIKVLPNYKLSYDGDVYDFSSILDGQQVVAEYPAIGVIKRVEGVISITLAFLYDTSLAEPHQPTDTSGFTYELSSGFVPDPVSYK